MEVHEAAMWREQPDLMREIADHVSGHRPMDLVPVDLPPEIEAQIEESRRHPERDRPRPRSACEIHQQDMREDPKYRRLYRRG